MDAKILEYEAELTKLTKQLALRAEDHNATLVEYRNALRTHRLQLMTSMATTTAFLTLFEAVRTIGTDIANDIQQARESNDPASITVAEKLEHYANALAQALQDSLNARQSSIEEQRASMELEGEDFRE